MYLIRGFGEFGLEERSKVTFVYVIRFRSARERNCNRLILFGKHNYIPIWSRV